MAINNRTSQSVIDSFINPNLTVGDFRDNIEDSVGQINANDTALKAETTIEAGPMASGDVSGTLTGRVAAVVPPMGDTMDADNRPAADAGWTGDLTINPMAVTTDKIADANVTTIKIADANVTTAKLDQTIGAQAVATETIRDDAVTGAKLDPAVAGTGLNQDADGNLNVDASYAQSAVWTTGDLPDALLIYRDGGTTNVDVTTVPPVGTILNITFTNGTAGQVNWPAGSVGIGLGTSTQIASGISNGTIWYYSETVGG